jgi:hypothetical protein
MDMQPFEADEAKRMIDLLINNCGRESGLGDLVFKIQARSGSEQIGHLIEQDGESSPAGVLLNDGGPAIRYDEMIWIGVGFGL